MLRICDLFDLSHTLAADYLSAFTYPYEALKGIKDVIAEIGAALPKELYTETAPHVWVAKSAKVMPSAYLGEYTIVGEETEVRHCAFVRGAALIGNGCVVGNSTEIKNAIVFDGVQIPHYNYVGDSILGNHAHLGAGAICSNLKADKTNIVIHAEKEIETGLRKIGAILADGADIGCGCVLNPGTVIGKNTRVYPLISLRGVISEYMIVKSANHAVSQRQ